MPSAAPRVVLQTSSDTQNAPSALLFGPTTPCERVVDCVVQISSYFGDGSVDVECYDGERGVVPRVEGGAAGAEEDQLLHGLSRLQQPLAR